MYWKMRIWYGKWGFNSGEGTGETTITFKEGGRHVDFPIHEQEGGDNKYQCLV